MDYELQDFKKDVIETSETVPVVIDFWAEWWGPCRQLGPVLEKLAGEAGERWKLVKIDTEQHPELASQFGIRGIPAVKMVYQKQIVAEFSGAQPEHLVRKWLEENLPGNGSAESGDLLEQVGELEAEGEREQARDLLDEEISEDSGDEFKVRYAMLLLPDQPEKAETWLSQVDDRVKYDLEYQALEMTRRLTGIAGGDLEPEGDNEEALSLYREAAIAFTNGEFEPALQKFIECLQIDRDLDDDGARKACITCFTILGERHPLTLKYRRRFSMALY
ncbi:MAG: tetratricopeptide repeat protein [Balneolaceae bacterium]|nr:tetratricopeptide repeat protein [Balneolaceae bacterium]